MIDREAVKEATLGISVILSAMGLLGLGMWGLATLFKWGAANHTLPYVFGGMGFVFVIVIWLLLYGLAKR